jgi:hypothetical protein
MLRHASDRCVVPPATWLPDHNELHHLGTAQQLDNPTNSVDMIKMTPSAVASPDYTTLPEFDQTHCRAPPQPVCNRARPHNHQPIHLTMVALLLVPVRSKSATAVTSESSMCGTYCKCAR